MIAARRALVAGGAGFVGSRLCEMLIDEGSSVTVLDSFITGRRENLAHLLTRGLVLIEGDVAKPEAMPEPHFDEIYNLASPASPVDFKRLATMILETASSGQRNLLELALSSRARVLFASTSEVYGDAEKHPQHESYFGNVNSIGPRSCYDEAKRYAEALTVAYRRERGSDARIARIFNTYGPRMRLDDGRIIPNFFMQALQHEPLTVYGDGSQTRSFCFVDDLAGGLIALMRSGEERPVNLGNPVECTVMQIANRINALTLNPAGVRFLPLPEDDPQQRRPDVRRAAESCGWAPTVGLDEGLERTLAYFRVALKKFDGRVRTPTIN